MSFNPEEHLIDLKGKFYLEAKWRIVWFREDHPFGSIVTEAVVIDIDKQYAIFRAQIFTEDGKLLATGTKHENVKGFPDYIEKAETGAVSRALAMAKYGTQFAKDFEEGVRLTDSPVTFPGKPAGNNPTAVPKPAPPADPEKAAAIREFVTLANEQVHSFLNSKVRDAFLIELMGWDASDPAPMLTVDYQLGTQKLRDIAASEPNAKPEAEPITDPFAETFNAPEEPQEPTQRAYAEPIGQGGKRK